VRKGRTYYLENIMTTSRTEMAEEKEHEQEKSANKIRSALLKIERTETI